MTTTTKYVWLNINTGEFSNSWDEDTQKKYVTDYDMKEHAERGVKLIKYECMNDPNFELYNQMKLR